jgi:hypothetical protein
VVIRIRHNMLRYSFLQQVPHSYENRGASVF